MHRSTILLATLIVGSLGVPSALGAEPIPGTQPLEMQGDLAAQMVAGIDRFLLRETAASVARRPGEINTQSRARLAKMLGVVDPREKCESLEFISSTSQPALVGKGDGFEVFAVRWPVLKGVDGEGLLLVPAKKPPLADVIAIPDADQTPEMLVGLMPGVAPESQFARRLAEAGCRVVVPMLIDRSDTYSVGVAGQRKTNQPHREYIYRQAFEMGRHIIGYEVQKVLALVDWFAKDSGKDPYDAAGIYGYGEGGLLALSAGALDPRIRAVCVSGYFGPREGLWQEPIYRNVFGLLTEFGDAELASHVGPNTGTQSGLVIEACRAPEIAGPPAPSNGRTGAGPGQITTPKLAEVKKELDRLRALGARRKESNFYQLVASGDGNGPVGSPAACTAFLKCLTKSEVSLSLGATPSHLRKDFDSNLRLKRQFDQLVDFTQDLMRESEYTRKSYWSQADRQSRSVEKWVETTKSYREKFYNDVIGHFELPLAEPRVRSRKVYDEPKYVGYEVVMDVFPDVFSYGILLVPKGIKTGERRSVVVCQHGLEGRPQDVAEPGKDLPAYHNFAGRLAEQGFITYAPQNPYIGKDLFRSLQRKANPLKKTLFSIIVPQHEQATRWLASLPMVDPERIAFYGLSYGGKTAMRVPALVERYCLSICSADFNEWIWKNASTRHPVSYMHSGEYEIFEFDLGNTFNYAEMAGLIAPRPFMVERGHRDGVAPDEWVAYEFAKVRLLYADLKIPDRTRIEFFDGPHTIHGVGTFEFLHEQLKQ